MSDNGWKIGNPIDRRTVLKGATAMAGTAMVGVSAALEEAYAQDPSTLVIACPGTPQGLDIEFDVEPRLDRLARLPLRLSGRLREDPGSERTGRPARGHLGAHRQALQHRIGAQARGILGDDGRRAQGDLQAARGGEEQLGQRTHRRGRQVDLGPQAPSEGPGHLPDRRAWPQVAGPGQDRGQTTRSPSIWRSPTRCC